MAEQRPRKFALLSAQGTACYETVLDEHEFNDPEMRAKIERACCGRRHIDPPIPGTWCEVTDNDAFYPEEENNG